MAVDSASKRGSAISVTSPWRTTLPIPDGAIAVGDRQHLALMYSGIDSSASAVTPVVSRTIGLDTNPSDILVIDTNPSDVLAVNA